MKKYKEFLYHIIDESEYLLKQSENITLEEFLGDETLKRAFVRSLEIIGEAVKKLPEDFKNRHKSIEWKKIAGMRDKLIHKYFGVDYHIVWDIVKNHIPELKKKTEEILEAEEKQD